MRIAFDIKLMRPGCALIQASLGGTAGIANLFDAEDWLVAPTPDMQVYPLTKEQLPLLVAKVKAARKRPSADTNKGDVTKLTPDAKECPAS